MATFEDASTSPTTSIGRVLVTLAVSLLLALAFGVRGLVHAGAGMEDGPKRALTLAAGQDLLRFSEALDLTWPWDRVEAAIGRSPQPATPPLLTAAGPVNRAPTGVVLARSRLRIPATTRRAGPRSSGRPPSGPVVKGARSAGLDSAIHPTRALQPKHMAHQTVQRAALARRPRPMAPTPTRVPTARNPLRLLVTGDSLTGYFGPDLVDEASRIGPVRGFVDTHNGTGLVRPDFVDWSLVARQQVAADNPDAVVAFIGGNDFQNMTMPGGQIILTGTPAWTGEYQRRAEVCMRIWTQRGTHRVYWLSMPPARDDAWTRNNRQINTALRRAAARVPGAEYLDILGPITNHGQYSDFVTVHGQPVLIRAPDGIHLNPAGSAIVAGEVLAVLEREWHLGARPGRHHGR